MTTPVKKIVSLTLALLLAGSASAANNDKEKENNGNHYGQTKETPVQVSRPTTSVPEPVTIALLAAGVGAIGVSIFRRRRK